jgi:hypothetical protein
MSRSRAADRGIISRDQLRRGRRRSTTSSARASVPARERAIPCFTTTKRRGRRPFRFRRGPIWRWRSRSRAGALSSERRETPRRAPRGNTNQRPESQAWWPTPPSPRLTAMGLPSIRQKSTLMGSPMVCSCLACRCRHWRWCRASDCCRGRPGRPASSRRAAGVACSGQQRYRGVASRWPARFLVAAVGRLTKTSPVPLESGPTPIVYPPNYSGHSACP